MYEQKNPYFLSVSEIFVVHPWLKGYFGKSLNGKESRKDLPLIRPVSSAIIRENCPTAACVFMPASVVTHFRIAPAPFRGQTSTVLI